MRSFIAAIAFSALAPLASAAEVMESSYVLPDGQRVLRHEILVGARPDAVWQMFSTSEGLQSFAAPLIAVDLRTGGVWEASESPGAKLGDPNNIRNEILSFIPGQMLAIRIVKTPPAFPSPELAKRVFTVIEMVRINDPNTTRVRISTLPYGSGEGWDQVYELFRAANAVVLQRLEQRFTKGPIDWNKR